MVSARHASRKREIARVHRVDRAKYEAMRDALLSVLPGKAPGISVAEAKALLLPKRPDDLFPGGAKAGSMRTGTPSLRICPV
ncbi:DUF6958 family protein [Roseibium salinum]|uniref:Uncharacterized protein n=1 Tax=Roseibium salinum TaxID=1604349 RepID=A0ABT3R061_9HYPH|nr:hypothetical protein [Roseibium sp. DSM 29163]MCX2722483.1 hypothetical protein [Roseibium sp. DSM 29163]MDN3719551.1 hypothetical protein [Roseibium salinum]